MLKQVQHDSLRLCQHDKRVKCRLGFNPTYDEIQFAASGGMGGKAARSFTPSNLNGSEFDSIPGLGGTSHTRANGNDHPTTSTPVLMTLTGGGTSNFIIYPNRVENVNGKQAKIGSNTASGEYIPNYYAAPGGNGGINSKISPLTQNRMPCGGWSGMPVDFTKGDAFNTSNADNLKCTNNINPNPPDNTLPDSSMFNPRRIFVTGDRDDAFMGPGGTHFTAELAGILSRARENEHAGVEGSSFPGATGGGGGSWRWLKGEEDGTTTPGAQGLPGYVIIFWTPPPDADS